jgi:hypothetical protein
MTIEALFSAMSSAPLVTLLVFLFPPLSALVLRFAAAAVIIDHLRVIVLFNGSILWLFGIAAVIFLVSKFGAAKLFKKKQN